MLRNLSCLIHSAKAGFFTILACGFMLGLLWSGARELWAHFLPGFGTVAQVFIVPRTPDVSVQSVESFISSLHRVYSVSVVSARQGAKYIQEHVMKTSHAIDSDGLPVRLVVAFQGVLDEKARSRFEEAVSRFGQVDTVMFDHIDNQQSLWGILGALFCFSMLSLYFMVSYLHRAPAQSSLLLQDFLLYRYLGLRWSIDWVLAFFFFILVAICSEWVLMLLGNYIFYIPQQFPEVPILFVLLISVFWLKRTMAHVDKEVKKCYIGNA
ncbi:MAG: hypothetical protein FJ186_00650 [Gammaproteobacteria bacterium]|nr:hypothetical protein [Gammaproteobacteria bacterium]